ncbi:hypothetical protein H6771_02735 [Candidatus Peribacteria bacterium]|nr:hypothetical protein [Candidatus Peribacteria bacterium]
MLPHLCPRLQRDHRYRARMLRMARGEFGDFFDTTLVADSLASSPLFPRLEAILRRKKQDVHRAFLPLFSNYFQAY